MLICDDNLPRQCGAQRSSGTHFARRCWMHEFRDPLHDIFERRQPRDPLAMLKGSNHVCHVATAGGSGQAILARKDIIIAFHAR